MQPRSGRKQLSHNRARTKARELTRFVAIDGEGVTSESGRHDYVLLTVGDETLRVKGKQTRLTWREIFPFLYAQYEIEPRAAYVGYYLGYDFCQWLRELPESRGEALFTKHGIARRQRKTSGGNPTPFPVHVGTEDEPWQWEIDILGTKRFALRRGTGEPPSKQNKNPFKWMYVCDVGSFFQQSFLKTLEEFSKIDASIVTQAEYEAIKEGKAKRSTAKLDADMIRYNQLECDVLARIMPLLNDGFKSCGISLTRKQWFGPGQAAQAWLKLVDAPSREEVEKRVPQWAREVGRLTYYGGWFEIFAHGPVPGDSWEYDVNSAYPNEIAKLPCLLHGEWKRGETRRWDTIERMRDRSLVAVYGTVRGKHPKVGTLPHRTEKGRIMRPLETRGWYWLREIDAAMRAGFIEKFSVREWVSYEGCPCPPPLRAMRDLYQERLRVGKKTPQGKSYKLIYNSGYGKFAQSVGAPKFSNAIYASLITSGCRCRILESIATHPRGADDLLMVATDGVYFRSRHPGLELDKDKLGAWDETKKRNLTLFMPGLYWDDEARDNLEKDEAPKLKSRGVPGRSMAKKILEADELWEEYRPGDAWPSVKLEIDFSMVTPGQALARRKWHTAGHVSRAERTITADPKDKRCKIRRRGDLIVSSPHARGELLESSPYERRFGEELEESPDVETIDGEALTLAREHLM